GKRVRLTSDSPAMNGSCISFTAALEFPPCQKEDSTGNLVYDEHCDDGMMEASGYVFNWTSWLDDYGFGKCTDLKRCNVFPDGKPFPQSNDWRRRGYVYVWHTMGECQSFTDLNHIMNQYIILLYNSIFSSNYSSLQCHMILQKSF
uniref:Glycoprotein (transmembrane) nmb n=1 Tax=Sinocyclocheilus rhinocerous TaxID=307959 RepID=A0A673LU95_9TELE